jgi:methionyl-tRNA formyltransferase
MNIIFMGTPEFAIPSLEAILKAGHTVPLVVSVPDKPRGRGRKPSPSPVKERALELGLEVASPESLRDPEFIQLLRSREPDLICVVAFRILPEEVYTIPRLGSFNLHGSLLPKYRGAAPIQRAIMAGEKETGVTTFFLKKRVDTGDMILRRIIPIGPDMTAGELHDIMMEVGASAVAETIGMIESGSIEPLPQDDTEATPAPKIFREDCRIDWSRPADILHNMVRGLSPYPGAFTEWRGEGLKILRTRVTDVAGLSPGEVRAEKHRLYVGAGTGSLEILELQREGRRGMGTEEFLRGTEVLSGERFV